MTPWEIVKRSEKSHQTALFAWANCAALFGFAVADDPRGYIKERREGLEPIYDPVPVLHRLFAIHNQGHGDKIRGAMARAEGVKAGVPDIMLPVTRCYSNHPTIKYAGLFIELKRPKEKGTQKGILSADQKGWIDFLTGQGYRCEVCFGWEEARDVIKDYLK